MGTRLLLRLLAVLLATSFCCSTAESQTEKPVLVSGKSECLDCEEKNVETGLAYQGLQVAIKCKTSNGDYKITGKLDKNGNYKVQLPTELIGDNGELKNECFAELHSVSNAPCPDNNGLNPSKLILKLKKDGVHIFSSAAKLQFSSATCASAFSWPYFSLPEWHPLNKPMPKFHLPPFKFPRKPHFPPIYKKPLPVPTYKPPVPIYKPLIPIKKPCPPFVKPHPPPVPIVKPFHPPVPIVPIKKPLPPPAPVVKPLLPPVPTYKPPIYKKPFPPIYKKPLPHLPPIYHKPSPHKPKFPPIYHKPWLPVFKKPYHYFPKYPPMYKKPPHT